MNSKILIVDDEANIRKVLKALLEQEHYTVHEARDGIEALALLKKEEIHTIITDLRMPNLDGMGLLKSVSKSYPDIPVIIITAHESVDSAVSALKLGALDYISKPFDKLEMMDVVKKAITVFHSKSKAPTDKEIHSELVNHSPQMKEVLNIIKKVADSPSTILITGESGTGKELAARALHENSSRSQKPFITINCSAIPATLIESELFGYEKGAFTGAVSAKPGRFELADQGTLFLDEIAEIPLELQAKLLRVLQENEIERVGSVKTLKIDIRLITATNKDLLEEVKKGTFREDLYYRLNVVPIYLPPLRERKEDFPHLVDFFIQKYNKKLGKNIRSIDKNAMDILMQYKWPGNIRELQHVIERMILLSEKDILTTENLPSEMSQLSTIMTPSIRPEDFAAQGSFKDIVKETTQKIEKNLIVKALEDTHGNVTKAAKILGISRKSLQNKMKEYQLRDPLAPDVEEDSE
ncbi:MAG: Fis family transcriptional regulator [Deltaproteobacteria bacterium GWA2_38_16]|nr:MAG: Fis family transcriptional regulator [Deltaproteobacteria bacterium GWA2_38_16]OGQ01943.1 MAG: Fis family transcriptional regulator [Deltaproteobacteria bacterium RIFCSPHIGHO2_02_FULL_38_15]OGQ34942.1 MAG: Fis family transcriptional regulator [Deltaproteobacteria bacterium RIFCSPLOWO2_01_FULL_38_9]OGQ63722.1 MAG: Fis family transcriptional regulator [Deltaproteobacteria bacterium RIFCSPLOWO2_12_FULL_38_8]HBQ21286.1 DNA-binding response regulator [Deltaproteobacteria bacterium]